MGTPQSIINTVLADVTAVIPNFSSLVSSYRLLVGAAEEIHRTPGMPEDVFERAAIRVDRAGTLIDILLELLCCKISFSSEFLTVTCAPVDLLRFIGNYSDKVDTPHHTAQQIVELEALRKILEKACGKSSCFQTPPPYQPSPPPSPNPVPPFSAPPPHPVGQQKEQAEELETESIAELETAAMEELETESSLRQSRSPHAKVRKPDAHTPVPPFDSPLRRRHI